MKEIRWNADKEIWLKQNRHVSFETVEKCMQDGTFMKIIPHPNKEKYKNQKVCYVNINKYIYYVPYVEDEEKIFLKT